MFPVAPRFDDCRGVPGGQSLHIALKSVCVIYICIYMYISGELWYTNMGRLIVG